MIKLIGVILALLMEVLIDIILTQLLKATSGEDMARPGSYKVMATRKLYCFARLIYLEVSALVEKPRDINEEIKSQKPADVEAGSLRIGDRKDQVQSLNQEILGYEAKI